VALVARENREDGVIVLTFNDPDRRNAMTVAMGKAIEESFVAIDEDPDVRCVVLTGAPPAFSAGGDLEMLEMLGRKARDERFDATSHMRRFYERFLSVRSSPVPVIAAVNGHAVGAGLCVALACDLRIVAEDAKLGLNFAQLGLHPGMGGSWLLPRVLGEQRAAELLYTGRLTTGRELTDAGLALDALPADQVLNRAIELAHQIGNSSPQVVRQLRSSLDGVLRRNLDEQLDLEARSQAINYGSNDFAEGLAAAKAKRAPNF